MAAKWHYIDERRFLILISVARGMDPPDDLTDHERETIERLKQSIADNPGMAIEVPVDW